MSEWESVSDGVPGSVSTSSLCRMRVPGGWLYLALDLVTCHDGGGEHPKPRERPVMAMVFVPAAPEEAA